jgi:hypothetical protein
MDPEPMIAVMIITDGRRDYIARTIASAANRLRGPIGEWWIYDDSGDPANRAWLAEMWPNMRHISHTDGRQGFGGAIRYAWNTLREQSACDHVFHLEDDFTFNREIPLDDMAEILAQHPELAQLALRRQAWNSEERAAGGVVEVRPDEFSQTSRWLRDGHVVDWLEHRLFWTTNPALFRRDLLDRFEWPDAMHSEGLFTREILAADSENRFGYWGGRDSGEWVHHIGENRIGTGY